MFSILMANYNAAQFIPESIDSVLKQTNSDWELIFVDDASTDNSLDIIAKYKDRRIRVFKHRKNQGYGKTLQTCARNAIGEIWGIFDSDDVLDCRAIEIMTREYKKYPDYSLLYSQHLVCDNKMKKIRIGQCGDLAPWTWFDIMSGKKKPKWPKIRVSHFKVFKKSFYDKTLGFTDFRRTVDKDIVLKLEEVGPIKFVDKVLYHYRAHSAGISRQKTTKTFGKEVTEQARQRRKKKK